MHNGLHKHSEDTEPGLADVSSTASPASTDEALFANATVQTFTVGTPPTPVKEVDLTAETIGNHVANLQRQRDDALGTLSLVRVELDGAKRKLASLEAAQTTRSSISDEAQKIIDALKVELGLKNRIGKKQCVEIRRLEATIDQSRRAAQNLAYNAILSTVPVVPHDRVLIVYTKPVGLIGIGGVQPRAHDENSCGVNIIASVVHHDGSYIDAVVDPGSCTPIGAHNVEDALLKVMEMSNIEKMDSHRGKKETLTAFRARVLKEVVADLKASPSLQKKVHLVDAAAALVDLLPGDAASR